MISKYMKTKKKDEPAITLSSNPDKKEFMRFGNDGSVYLKGRKIDVDKELAQAFTYCVIEMSGYSPSSLIESIRNSANIRHDSELLSHLKSCLKHCKKQNGMNFCKNCGLDGEIVN